MKSLHQFREAKRSSLQNAASDARASIKDWKEKMKMVQDQIDFLKNQRLAEMERKLKMAEKKFSEGDYDWIGRELFFNGDLY